MFRGSLVSFFQTFLSSPLYIERILEIIDQCKNRYEWVHTTLKCNNTLIINFNYPNLSAGINCSTTSESIISELQIQ